MNKQHQNLPADPKPADFLPTSVKEMKALGWDYVDVVLFSGDAYVDHPSFAAAVIGRVLQAHGYRVAIVPQPNWQDDLRDFKKFGKPRLFFGVSAGAMDSMINHYTANRRLRSDDAYTPGGKHGKRPDYPTIVYSNILRSLFPDTPIVTGGIEASMRRLSHYDYWENRIRPSILLDAHVDMLIYGMGEKAVVELAGRLANGEKISEITDLRQTAILLPASELKKVNEEENIILNSFEKCLADKRCQAKNFMHIEQQSNRMDGGKTLYQQHGKKVVKINPMFPAMTSGEIDAAFDLPYTRLPHPRYKGKRIPAYDMIKFSVNLHRGCFGGCAFCTISAHQGKFIASRSRESIMREVKQVVSMPDFKGYITDLGGPSANMYAMGGRDRKLCSKCMRPSCLHPSPCPNLDNDHGELLKIYHEVDSLPEVKKSFIGSGVRYDLSMHRSGNKEADRNNDRFNTELICNHVSGRLKVAPEHTADHVLNIMRKPSFTLFHQFKQLFDNVNRKHGLNQQLIPYFISSHPGCHEIDMANLAVETRDMNMQLEQVQDFTPSPMTLSTEIYYTGIHPYTGEKIFTATTRDEKLSQRKYFFWYDRSYHDDIVRSLTRLHRPDLIKRLFMPKASSPNNNPSQPEKTKAIQKKNPPQKARKRNRK